MCCYSLTVNTVLAVQQVLKMAIRTYKLPPFTKLSLLAHRWSQYGITVALFYLQSYYGGIQSSAVGHSAQSNYQWQVISSDGF